MQKNGYFLLGFNEDPVVVNCNNLNDKCQDTFNNLYKFLTVQHYKHMVLFPYKIKCVLCAVLPFYFCKIEFINPNWMWLRIILQVSLDTISDNFWHEQLAIAVVSLRRDPKGTKAWLICWKGNSSHQTTITQSPLLRNHPTNIFIRSRSCAWFGKSSVNSM